MRAARDVARESARGYNRVIDVPRLELAGSQDVGYRCTSFIAGRVTRCGYNRVIDVPSL